MIRENMGMANTIIATIPSEILLVKMLEKFFDGSQFGNMPITVIDK